MTITKEELVSLIKETVASMKSEQKTDTQEMQNAECACDPTDKMVDNACGEKADVAKNEDINEEINEEIMEGKEEGKTKEEIKEEIKEKIAEEKMDDKEDDEKEVIRIEALNSSPMAFKDVSGKDDWRNLHGDRFWKYLADHPEITR